MYKALENSLYKRDRKKFEQLRNRADGFNSSYNGSNIIQDDIFHVIQNYAKRKDCPLELLRYPIKDTELCACTFVREGTIFIMLNSALPLSKQIFALGHELYHIWCYLEDDDNDLVENGSILNSETLDISSTEIEEMEANAFSGLLLVPSDTLRQQVRIYNIDTNHITVNDVLMLMEIFAIPFKAMVLRLFEESLITEEQVRDLFLISSDEIYALIKKTGVAARWNAPPDKVVRLGGLDEYFETNVENESLMPSRQKIDESRIKELYNYFKN